MSVVTSKYFRNRKVGHGVGECDETFTYPIEDSLKTYGLDDKFHMEFSHESMYTSRNSIVLNVADAKRLKKQLEEFIALNS